VPTGSSFRWDGVFAGATDGAEDPRHWWRAANGDYPGVLKLDFGAPAIITSMNITGGDAGFKVLLTYRSDDGRTWSLVRQESTPLNCNPGSTTEHEGWVQPTRYVMIQMEERCEGVHNTGSFTVAEWSVFGYFNVRMALQHRRTWPICEDLGPCFTYTRLEAAQASCLADESCDGFSFSSASIAGGRGSGCYKTRCRDHASGRGFGRGTHGYWVKRHGCHSPSTPSYLDQPSGLEVCGP